MFIQLGDIAPDFTAPSTQGTIRFHEYLGDSWGLLFSHPADYTPVCTTELGAFATRKGDFDARDIKLVGVSVDSLESHRGWSEDIARTQGTALNYPLVADEDRAVASLYGMIHPKAVATATVRTVFVIAPDKTVRLTLTYPASVGRNIDEILRAIDALQLTSELPVSTPVDWNRGDDVIVSPSLSDDEAAERFPAGVTTLTSYLRTTPQPTR